MKVLLIYPNKGSRRNTPIGLAMASAVLKRAGHEVELFDTTNYEQEGFSEKEVGEKILDFKPVDLGIIKEKVDIPIKLEEKINSFKPKLIAFSFLSTHLIGEDEYDMCMQGIELINALPQLNIPIFVGGLHPTFSPEEIIFKKKINIICRGEFEEALVELANKIEMGEDIKNIKNLWVMQKEIIYKNELRPLICNLDDLPFADYSIFNSQSFLRPYEGKIVRGIDFEISRGCPYSCSYCTTPLIKGLYSGQKYHREKSVERILDEIKHLKEKYKINFIKFHDENFLTMGEEKMEALAPLFKEKIGIPFVVEIRPEAISKRKAELLKEMGCVSASIGIECGNEEFRKKILNRYMSNEKIIESIKHLREVGVRTRTFNMIGLPYETRELIFETIKLNKESKVDSCGVTYFSPFKGTQLRQICLDNGLIKNCSELLHTRESSILKMPSISQKEIKGLMKTFNMYVCFPEWIYPLIKEAEGEDECSNKLFNLLKILFQKYSSKLL